MEAETRSQQPGGVVNRSEKLQWRWQTYLGLNILANTLFHHGGSSECLDSPLDFTDDSEIGLGKMT